MSLSSRIAMSLANYDNENSIGSRLRRNRVAPLLYLIEKAFLAHGQVSVVDIGGTRAYWNVIPVEFLRRNKVRVTVVNIPGTPLPQDDDMFIFRHGDGCDLSDIPDRSFHIAMSNSVIEHVGDWPKMKQFAAEISRVARDYVVQTPNYWFPLEPHCWFPFFQWLPKPWKMMIVSQFELGYWPRAHSVDEAVQIVDSARLLNRKMFSALFTDADIRTERIALLPKSFVAVRDLG